MHESSPYLLLHAHDPVDWYPWGEEAFAKARREGKPIFLSIGYSTCYWCHVMEREVFSRPAIAELMNRWFVSVKVDREERPEVDEVYIAATELMNGGAGWPNSLFVTPRLEPFYAGTYFPPAARDGQPGFPTVLRDVHAAWEGKRAEVEATAARVAAGVRRAVAAESAPAAEVPAAAAAAASVAALESRFSAATGSFGGPPNFPQPANLFLLWEAGEAAAGARARGMVVESLRAMAEGAIYDQVGGGFHRYTLDPRWRLPHFEKMLYDNAGLAEVAALAGETARDPELERAGRGTLDFLLAEMALPAGGFASAIDAETAGEEGAYYVWTDAELRAALGAEGYRFLTPIFGFDAPPNLPRGRRTLFLARPLAEQAARLGLSPPALAARMAPHLARLRAARRRRRRPLVDDKALADWNGMAIAALARGAEAWSEPRYRDAAARAAGFVLARLRGEDGLLRHSYRDGPAGGGRARIPAYLDDYAFLIHGLLTLAETGGARPPGRSPRWLSEAERLAGEMDRRLAAPRGGWFLSAAEPDLLARTETVADEAIPAGNAVAILDLLRLARATGKAAYRARAARALRAFAPELARHPAAVPTLALAVARYHAVPAAASGAPAPAAPVAPAPGAGGTLARLAEQVAAAEGRFTGPAAAAGGWRKFELRLTLRPGWHVNANPASLPELIPTRVEGDVRGLVYPKAESLRLAFAEDRLAVYTGRVVVRGEVKDGARDVRLTYQPCDDRRCLPPVTRPVRLVEVEGP